MTMIQTLGQTVGLARETIITLDTLRKQRNVADYSGDIVPPAAVEACVAQAQALQQEVIRWLKQHKPELLEQ